MIYNFFSYLLWLIREVWYSAMTVAQIIWTPKMPINPGFDEIRTLQTSEGLKVLYANSITLTPGTFTVDMTEDKLLVHSLVRQDIWPDEMDLRIKKIKK